LSSIWDIVAFSILTITLIFLAVNVVILRNEKISLLRLMAQQHLDAATLENRMLEMSEELALLRNTDSDFVKFLSDTRESAFSFIDEVQKEITDLKAAVGSNDIDKIKNISNNLFNFLPNPNDVVE
jgi:hypothetical protein